MSLRDEFEALQKSIFGTSDYELRKSDNGEYVSILFANEFKIFAAAYQSATERALRIGLDVHAWASVRNLNWRAVLTEYERRIKGDSNGQD